MNLEIIQKAAPDFQDWSYLQLDIAEHIIERDLRALWALRLKTDLDYARMESLNNLLVAVLKKRDQYDAGLQAYANRPNR